MGDVDFIIQLLEELSAFNSSNELYYSVFSIEQLLKNVAISFAISLDTNEADIEFSSSISDSLGEFTGDKIKLQELVLNLLKNAEEAITEQGSIHLAASRNGDIITITCTDTGCGITPEQMECIFQPFVTYKQGGTGLGLAICKRIIDSHRGTLTVSSKPGSGATFTVSLPL